MYNTNIHIGYDFLTNAQQSKLYLLELSFESIMHTGETLLLVMHNLLQHNDLLAL